MDEEGFSIREFARRYRIDRRRISEAIHAELLAIEEEVFQASINTSLDVSLSHYMMGKDGSIAGTEKSLETTR